MPAVFLACLLIAGCEREPAVDPAVAALAGEIDEELLDGLARRREGTRYLRRAMFHIESARREGRDPA